MTIRVIETDKATSGGLRFATRATPEPGYGEVLIDVTHTSLNFGETRRGARGLEADGTVLGWDASGVIVAVGPQTKAPPIGTVVVTRAPLGAGQKSALHMLRISRSFRRVSIRQKLQPCQRQLLRRWRPCSLVGQFSARQFSSPVLLAV
ncbi:hypothetical protein HGG75_14390 [Ochrobactrum pseudogrignonense]|nr:hypothetical protein [Brucella pseudogrignonensis]